MNKQHQIVPYEPQTVELGKQAKTIRNMPSVFHLLAALLWRIPLRWKVLLAVSGATAYISPQFAAALFYVWVVVFLIWLARRRS